MPGLLSQLQPDPNEDDPNAPPQMPPGAPGQPVPPPSGAPSDGPPPDASQPAMASGGPGDNPPPDDQSGQQPDDSGGEEASPAEDQQFKAFVGNAMNLIYTPQTMPKILNRLQENGGDPVGALAEVSVMIVQRVSESAEKAGQQIPPEVIFHAGAEIMNDLAELSSKSGAHDYTDEELNNAFIRGVDMYRDKLDKQGKLDHASAQADVQRLNAASADGSLEAAIPGLKEYADKAAASAPPDQGNGQDQAAPPGPDENAPPSDQAPAPAPMSKQPPMSQPPQGAFKRKGNRLKAKRKN